MEKKNFITKYQIIESDNIDDFILANLMEGIGKDQIVIKKTIELIYYLGNVLYNNTTPGNELMLIYTLNNKKTIVFFYIMRTLLPCIIEKYPILKLLYYLLDLRHFLRFLSNSNGVGPTLFESLFGIMKYSENDISLLTQGNTIILKNILLRELSLLLSFLFPKSKNNHLIQTKEISCLCQICKNLPTNAVNFPCMHLYCYCCYMNHPNNINIDCPSYCIICNQ